MARSSPRPTKSQSEIVIITGLSGSGKATVLKCLEDLGYYAVDNLPVDLIPTFAELTQQAQGASRAAIVVDIREGTALKRFPEIFRSLQERMHARLVFLEADNAALLRRFSETRRPHPLVRAGSVTKSVQQERKQLAAIRKLAEPVIDTTHLTAHELRSLIEEKFAGRRKGSRLAVSVISFGFRHGLPPDADLVFDVRFLPNPNYVPALRKKTGRHPAVAKFIRSYPQTQEFLERVAGMLLYLIPHYIAEGKSYLTIAFGCTGGHHRSVMIADRIRERLGEAGYETRGSDRDLHRPY